MYSHRLGYRLFVHPKFLDMLRLHSKTVFKLNAAFLLFLILSMFVVILNVATVQNIYPATGNITVASNSRCGFELSTRRNFTVPLFVEERVGIVVYKDHN